MEAHSYLRGRLLRAVVASSIDCSCHHDDRTGMVEAVRVADHGVDGHLKVCRGCTEDDEDEEVIGRRGSSSSRTGGQDNG